MYTEKCDQIDCINPLLQHSMVHKKEFGQSRLPFFELGMKHPTRVQNFKFSNF
jgi:hypothetical protein